VGRDPELLAKLQQIDGEGKYITRPVRAAGKLYADSKHARCIFIKGQQYLPISSLVNAFTFQEFCARQEA